MSFNLLGNRILIIRMEVKCLTARQYVWKMLKLYEIFLNHYKYKFLSDKNGKEAKGKEIENHGKHNQSKI